MMNGKLRLNLGCGENHLDGFVNVDKFGQPDVRHDLETFPWPWEDDSVSEILLSHVLEHLGGTSDLFFGMIKEMYRVCRPKAQVRIVVPHPRHDDFISDPTHVRIITPEILEVFSKNKNADWIERKCANSPLGIYLDVDFEIMGTNLVLDPQWQEKLEDKTISKGDLFEAMRKYNNVIKEIQIVMRVIK